MKVRTVKRYRCDFCTKSGCSKHHMERHERHCVHNPKRCCRMCEHATGEPLAVPKPLDDLIAALHEGGLDALRKLAEGCPACMLAAIVQNRARDGFTDETNFYADFDFKKEREAMWTEANNARSSHP